MKEVISKIAHPQKVDDNIPAPLRSSSRARGGEVIIAAISSSTLLFATSPVLLCHPRDIITAVQCTVGLEGGSSGHGNFFNGFSPKMASPRKWLLPGNGFSWEITSPQEIQSTSHFNLISFWHYFGKNLTPVAKVRLIKILYH